MVAVVSGSGLGLFNSSASSLGGAGTNGDPVVGRGRDRVYVNSSTGNLIVQSVDETLAALGLDFAGVRTYNSQGLTDEDNNDQWRLGVQQRVYKLTGTVNTAGSTVTKVFGDGAEVIYTWNATRSRYESGDGDGANDFLTWNSGNSRWTWTDGSTRSQEEYGLVDGVQRIRVSRDADGNSVAYNYDDPVNLKLLTSVSMAGSTAQSVFFDYSGTNLTGVRVVSNGVTQTLTRYAYDTSNRLQTVTVDLTPADNAVTDNVTYTTTYAYDSTSTRIASITQKDGSSVAFQYQLINGEYRLWTVTDAENRITTFTYNTVAGTAVTSAGVNSALLSTTDTINYSPLAGALTTSPAGWNNAAIRDASTSTVADPRMAFDANGNGFLVWRVGSNVVAQRYTRATNSWGPETILDNSTATPTLPSLSMDTTGNAIVAWVQSDGTANSVFAARYDAATGVWTKFTNPIDTNASDTNLVATRPVNTGTYTLVTAINGTSAVVSWQHNQADTGSVYNLYAARLSGSTWSPAESVEALAATAGQQSIAIDDQGNIAVAFQQADATATNVYVNRFTASTSTWSGAVQRDTAPTSGASDPRIAFDASGNGILIYRVGASVFAQRYTRSTNSWSATETTLDALSTNATALQLALDANGTGIAAWVQADASGASVYAARFNGTTWSAAVPIDAPAATLNTPVNANGYTMMVSVAGNRAAIVWQQNQTATGSVYDAYAARFDGTSWSAAELIEQRADNAAQPVVAIDSLGNVTAAFQQNDGSAVSAMVSRYNVAAAGSYYVVPAGATWQSVVNAVYGATTAAAATELQARLAPQTLATNVQLGGFPTTLAVLTTLPAFYRVVAGDTWSIVTNKLYGTTDANAIAALQAYAGTTTLTVNGRITAPATLKYQAVGTTATVYQATTVQNSLTIPTAYAQDTQGRVTSTIVAGIETRFAYDPTTGNVSTVTEDPTGLNRITTFTYDPVTGLLMNTRDSLGNTVARTYTTNNQLLTVTQYTVPDPDGAGAGVPSGALVTRYAYDSENHLRFEISADGRVTEHQYNAAGQRVLTFNHLAAAYGAASPYAETDLQTWAAGAGAGVRERIDYTYDWRGNLQTLTRWAATTPAGAGTGPSSVTQFVYDQRGQLLQTIDPRGVAVTADGLTNTLAYSKTYVYDGLGRVRTAVEWLKPLDADGALRTRTTSNVYDDVNRRTTTTLDNGLASISNYNRDGELVNINNGALGTTTYVYDAGGRLRIVKDPTNVRQFSFYDDANRLIGNVDGDGTVTEFIYDKVSQVIKTVRYSVLLTSTRLASLFDASGNPTAVTFATLRTEAGTSSTTDQVSRNVYDNAGRLVYKIDTIGFDTTLNVPIDAVTKFSYDGANRLVEELQYRNTISVARATDQVLPSAVTVAAHAEDRRTRHFYDNSGNRVATLDAAGYLTEFTYDNAGHLITQFERANPVASGLWAAGTLSQLQTSAGTDTTITTDDTEQDISTYFYYDSQGRLSGQLDGEGFYTKTNYDVAGNATSMVRYDRGLTYTSRPAQTTIEADVLGAASHTNTREYDGAGRLVREINFESTATRYEYDGVDNLLSVRSAEGDAVDERWTSTRYDLLGRVVRELSAEGRVALAALGASPTQAAIDDVWNRFGVLYAYDTGGRRISATARPDDVQTNVTRYFYDNDGRLRFEVNQLGERKEYRYNALGQLTDQIAYYNRIVTTGLNGGLLTTTLTATLTSLADAARDTKTVNAYTLRGSLKSSITLEGATVTQTYNTFGEVDTQTVGAGAEGVVTSFVYTGRGEIKQTLRNGVLFETRDYDAFGRVWKITDGRGKISQFEYDRLGRQLAAVDELGGRSTTTYDGYSRVKLTDDATPGTNNTVYNYDDVLRTMTVDTPEGVRIVTTHNRQDETATVTIGTTGTTINTKSFTYDKNGQVLFAFEGGVQVAANTYDRGGRQVTQVDGRGTTTTIAYDTANRVFTTTVDSPSGGLRRVTTYVYDGIGRIYDVTDPTGALTRTTYDRDGRIAQVAIDPTGLNLRTTYAYNTRNNTTTVTEMSGSSLPRRTQYLFDSLGRRSEEIVDPTSLGGTLNLRTQYKYDNNDNLTRKIDSRGFSCWYVYDDKNRLTHEIDALGGLTQMAYDAADRLVSTRHYVTPISAANLSSLAGNNTPAAGDFTPISNALDQIDRSYYDKDGREKYSINGVGTVTQRTFDAAGNVTRLRVISAAQFTGAYADLAAVETALGATITNNLAAADRVTWNAFDSRGRAEFSINSMNGTVGSVQRFTYDGNGNVIASCVFATSRALTLATDLSTLQSWATANGNATYDQVTRYWFDKADRQRFVLDAEGYATEIEYNDLTRATTMLSYARRQTGIVALGSASTDADANSALLFDTVNNQDRTRYSWGDAAGRPRFSLDAEGYLTETRYNDATGALATIAYAQKPSPLTASSDLAAVNGAVATTPARDRTSLLWIDAAGRERFAMDAEGYAVETRYDDVTGTRRVIKYAQSVYNATPPVTPPTLASTFTAVNTAITGLVNTNDQTTRTNLDNVGRVSSVTQAEGSADAVTEYYQYNGAGDKTKFTNAKGGSAGAVAYTWDYGYDAAGNLVTETTPLVDVYSVTASAGGLSVGGAANQRLVTRFQYDFLGNLTRRTEADGTSQARVTRYEYDALGRQVRTFYPPIPVYNAAGDTANPWGIGGTIAPVETAPQDLYTEITYDALGNAFRSRDAAGNFSFKTYDRLGQAEYEIDPIPEGNTDPAVKNYVSRHQYDAFGNETSLTRYATGLASKPSTTGTTLRAADFTVTTGADDRVMTTAWDRRNLKTSVTLASLANNFRRAPGTTAGAVFTGAGTTTYLYNAFGEVNLSRVLVQAGVLQDTYSYYDRRGLKVAELDPLKYFTKYEYDSTGDLTRQIEYARPITAPVDTTAPPTEVATPTSLGIGAVGTEQGFDREVIFGYDRLNRRTSQREVNVEQYSLDTSGTLSSTTSPFADITTGYAYDVLGNQICVTDAAGNKTWTYYDVLGRTIAVIEPVRDLGDGAASVNTINRAAGAQRLPVTRYLLDALGNTLQQIQYFKAIPDGTVPTATLPTAFAVDANDRTATMQYDNQGHVIRTEDAIGADRYASYGANGLLVKEWQVVTNALNTGTVTDTLVTIHKYDALGNEIETQTPVTHTGGTLIKTSRTTFNAFGDIKTRGTVDATFAPNGDQEYFDYDAAGRVWRTNSGDGVTKVFLYDLAGNVTVELRAQGVDLKTGALAVGGSVTMNTLQDVLNRLGASVATDGFMRTETVYDAKGNVLEKYTPSYTIASGTLPQAVNDPQVGVVAGSPTPGAVYLHWAGVDLPSIVKSFSYRLQGAPTWTPATVVVLPGDRLGIDVTQLRNADYEYQVRYTRQYQSSSFAASTGTFRVNIPTITGVTGVTQDSFTDADSVGNLSVQPPAGVASSIWRASSQYSSPPGGSAPGGNPPQWWGGNAVTLNWAATSGQRLHVVIDYNFRTTSGTDAGFGTSRGEYTTNTSTMSMSWTDNPWPGGGGFDHVTRVRIYSVDASDNHVALLRDSRPDLSTPGLVWTAPTDTSVSAVFRYKLTSAPTYAPSDQVTAGRSPGGQFSVNVFTLLLSGAQYDYQIEYRRGGVAIAMKEGRITSNGGSVTTSINGVISPDTLTFWGDPVAEPTISGLTMSWTPPSTGVSVLFEYGTTSALGSTLNVDTTTSPWKVLLNPLVPPTDSTNYFYRTTYRIGGRLVSQQTGNFTVTAGTNTATWGTSVAVDGAPGASEQVGPLTGTSSVLNASSIWRASSQFSSPPGGSAPGGNPPQWWGGNAVSLNWIPTTGQRLHVVIDYNFRTTTGTDAGFGTSRGEYTTNTSTMSMSWTDNPWPGGGGFDHVTRVRIYTVDASDNHVAMIRDSLSPATVPGPVGMTWAAPNDTLLTYKFFYGSTERTITRSGNTLSVDLSGIPSGAYSYRVEYYKPGESTPIVNRTGTFTTDTVSITINNQTPASFDPAWITVSPSGSSVAWSRTAAASDSVILEYWNGSSYVNLGLSRPGDNTSWSYNFAGFGVGTWNYRLRYRNSSGQLLAQSTGSVTVTNSVVNIPASAALYGSRANSTDPTDPITNITTTLTDNVFRWTFGKDSPTNDTVTFSYTINGSTTTLNTSAQLGNGSSFAVAMSIPEGTSNVTWSITYTHPGESNPYAMASGGGVVNYTRTVVPPTSITLDTQGNVYPSPVPISAPVDAGGGFLGWATAPDANTNIEFFYTPSGGTRTPWTGSFVAFGLGRKIDVSGLAAGTYRYSIKYTHIGQPTEYAKADGYFTITKADGAASGTATVGPAYPETLLLSGVAIQNRPLTNPPEAVWARRDFTTPPTYIPSIEPITSPGYGGGFIQDAPPSTASPKGIYHQVSPASAYSSYIGMVFVWTPNTGLDTRITFEYRPRGSTGGYTPINVYRVIGYTQVGAEVTSLVAGDYEFRVAYTLTGSSTPFASATGIFTRTADGQNQAVSIDPATVPQAVPANPVLKQSVDRWGNTIAVQDASANVTEYRYDAHNQQVQVTAPLVDYLDTRTTFTDATTSDRPRTYNYLDKLGRQIATRDGNGNLMRYYYNAAGQLVTTQNADSGDFTIGSFQRNEYDTFGQVIQSSDELTSGVAAAHIDNLGFRTRNFYDRGGRLTDVWREVFDNSMPPAGTITPTPLLQTLSYGYDENNRRIRETNGMGEVTRYAYDLQGNVILRRTPGLNDTRYTYNVHGAKATEEVDVYTGGVFTRQTWSNDYFGRVRGHVGWTLFNGGANAASFGGGTGASYTYDYNMAGLLYLQRSNEGQRIEFTFDAAGQTTVIRDIAANRQTYITYDTAGRKQRERVVVDGLIHQDTKTDYDAMGRISFVEDPDYRLSYRYDLAGNRTLIHDEFVNHAATRTVEDLYFTYDKMNRVKLGQGVKTAVPATSPTQYQVTMSGPIGAAQGFIYTYNARGDRTSVTQSDIVWTLNGTTWSGVRTSIPNTEKYTYDGLGRLTDVERKTNTGTGFTLYRHNVYDKANRGTSETNYFLEDSAIANRTTVTGYDADGRASTQTTTKGGEYETIVSFGAATLSGGVWSAGYDKAGNLRGYTVKQFDHGHQNTTNPLITTENRFTYELGETFMVSYESARSSSSSVPANQLPKNGDVYREYNADEELVKARDATTLSKSRGYVNNQQGQVLTSVQTDVTSAAQLAAAMDAAVAHSSLNGQNNFTKAQHSFYFNGAMLGTFGQLQPNAQGEFKGNFDVNYTPISEEYPMSTPPTVVAQKGDTLRIIAARIYGDASLWYLLADENALTSPDEVIPEGTSLRVPNNVVSLANSANVYKPYDASKAIGDLSPSQPIPPPPRQHCNMLAMVLIIIVMVVVSIFTAGAAAAAMSPMLGGSFSAIMSAGASAMAGTATGLTAIGSMVAAGIGAAAGSIVSQGLGMALGVQDKFDWKGVATSALSAGIGAGLGAAGTAFDAVKTFAGAHPYLYAAASAATGSALTQGVSVAVKLQDKFSWREVAISAAAAGASEVAGNYAGSRMNHTSMNLFRTGQAARGPLTNFATGIVKGYTTAGVRAAFGGKFDVVQVTADVFGHAIGNAIVEETITHLPSEMKNATAAEKAAFRAAVRAGFSRADSFEMVFNPDVNPYINKRGAMDDSLRAAGVSDVDDLPDDQKANLIDRLYPEGEVDIETIDQPPEPATPREQPSLQTRLGKGLSRVVVGTTDALASLVDTVGPKKFEAGMFLISWGLGGLPKAVVSFTFGQKVEELKQKALAPIKESVSEMIGTYGFDAETAEEYQAVKPASDTVSSVTVGFAFSALLGGGIAGIVQGIKSYRQKQAQALDDRAVLRARQLEQRQNLDGEAGPPISGKSLAAFKRDEIVNMDPKLRPDAATYMTKAELAAHRALFDKGVVKITAGAPNRAGPAGKVLGGPGGTFVLPKDVAEKILKDANGDISKVEKALNLKPGELGKSPVLIDIPHPTGLKMPSGRELGVNSQWVPGGFTANGIPEAVINRVLPGSYTVKPLF